VLCFDVSDTESSEPIYAIAVDGLPKTVVIKSSGNSIDVLATFEDIGGCLIRYSVNKKQESTTSILKIISKDNIISSTFSGEGVTSASGLTTLPYFSYFSINDENGDLLNEIILKEHSTKSSSNLKEKTNEIANSNAVAILGPNDIGGVKRPIVNENNDGDVAILKKIKTDSIEEEELTLEQRLDILNDSISVMEKNVNVRSKNNDIAQAPTSDSLVTLIEQSLQSGDDTLLEQCLSCEDINVVEATAKRLPISRIVVFIKKLVSKFERRPSRGLLLTRWLAALLRFHTSYLIAVPDLSHQLAGLSQILEQRLTSYTKLASLSGRLDLLMSQVTAPSVTEKSGSKPSKPLKVYKEK
jgi:U3 small nucleolar RNA-associated protein 5